MLKEVRFTLYEVFGYLLPGTISFAAAAIFFHTIFFFAEPLRLPATLDGRLLALFVAYFAGHVTQALGNFFTGISVERAILDPKTSPAKRPKWRRFFSVPDLAPASIRERALSIAAKDLEGGAKADLSAEWLFDVCDEDLVQHGELSDREVYQYREGFYRGTALGLFLLAIALVIRLFVGGGVLQMNGTPISVTRGMVGAALAFVLPSAVLCYRRFKRFGHYRVSRALLAYILNHHKRTDPGSKESRHHA
jgi:hypothetical protein